MKVSESSVHIELGNHIQSIGDTDAAYRKLEDGDLSGSFWTEAVTDRAVKYRPDVIVSDSLSVTDDVDFSSIDDPETRRRYQVFRYSFMPPRIAERLSKDMLLVGGDTTIFSNLMLEESQGDTFGRFFVPYMKASGAVVAMTLGYRLLRKYEERMQLKAQVAHRENTHDPLIEAKNSSLASPEDDLVDREPERVSRRSFLGLGLAATTGLYMAGALAPSMVADLPTHAADDALEISDFFGNLRGSSDAKTWLDGRTALLIQKGHDESVRQQAVVSVVMGSGHYYRSEEFNKSEKARRLAIQDYARLLLKLVETTSSTYTGLNEEERANQAFFELVGSSQFLISPNGVDDMQRLKPVYSEKIVGYIADVFRQKA